MNTDPIKPNQDLVRMLSPVKNGNAIDGGLLGSFCLQQDCSGRTPDFDGIKWRQRFQRITG